MVLAHPPPETRCASEPAAFSPAAMTPFCTTLKYRPPIVMVPARRGPALAATVNETEPGPEPLREPVIVTQPESLVALQVQPLPAVTPIVPLSPAVAKNCPPGVME